MFITGKATMESQVADQPIVMDALRISNHIKCFLTPSITNMDNYLQRTYCGHSRGPVVPKLKSMDLPSLPRSRSVSEISRIGNDMRPHTTMSLRKSLSSIPRYGSLKLREAYALEMSSVTYEECVQKVSTMPNSRSDVGLSTAPSEVTTRA